MQKIILPLILLVISILSSQCRKEQDEPFIYPSMGNHGPNLLYPQDSTKVSIGEIYSLSVDLLEDPIEIHIINLNAAIDTMQWGFEPNTINGWNISTFDTLTHFQKLNNSKVSHIDAGIKFKDAGTFKIEIYENQSSTPLRSTIITGIDN